jgi:hypothetical protein
MITKKGFLICFILISFSSVGAFAQYKVLITNLNTKEEYVLNQNEAFYFGTSKNDEVLKGAITGYVESGNALSIDNKLYPINEITWIDFKGHKPKKHTSKVSKILLYFGGALIGFSAYEYFEVDDKKTALIAIGAGAACNLGALAFWLFPRQPQFDFSTKHLIEVVKLMPNEEKNQ